MAGQRRKTSSSDAGSAIDYSSNMQQDLGVFAAPDVKVKISHPNDFLADLDNLVGVGRQNHTCSVKRTIDALDEPLKSKLEAAVTNEDIVVARLTEMLRKYGINISSDVMRRHRRRMLGKDGCSCPIPKKVIDES
jgi:hypothetical protein